MAAAVSFRAAVASAALGGLRLRSSPCRPSLKPFFLSSFPNASVRMCVSARRGDGGSGDDAVVKGIAAATSDKIVLEEVRHIMEIARRVSSTKGTHSTDFLTPPTLKAALTAVEKLGDVKATAHGGHPQAERCCLSISHPDTLEAVSDTVSALRISGNFRFEPCSHGDFLGAILGTGVVRDKIGDILLQGDNGAQVIVVPELVDHLVSSLNKVGNVPVSCAEIPLLALEYEPPRTKSFKAVEASLRVDAVASAGFKISRTKLANLISSGDVLINASTVTKNGTNLKTGDVVSVSGKGRLKIGEIVTTRKGRYAVELIRYL